jgi:cytochrome c2
MRVFFEKRCARCHSVLGEGGRAAPDLARAPAGHLSAAELVAATWNHAPEMWEKIQAERLPAPRFSAQEMTDLFAFLYSVRSLDEPGDPACGRRLLSEKRCSQCHSVSGEGGRVGPDFRRWAGYRNPVSWIQAMWNHGAAMQRLMAARRGHRDAGDCSPGESRSGSGPAVVRGQGLLLLSWRSGRR